MIEHYPSISAVEFAEACEIIERKCHDNLQGTHWLSVKWHEEELQIKQASVVDRKAKYVTYARKGKESEIYAEKELYIGEDDTDAVNRYSEPVYEQGRPAVDFSILLSPTYQVPVLWFTLSSSKVARAEDLEEVYSRVVAPGSHESLRGIGIMGGISLANHPITDRPSFFIHPCNTPEAMVALNDGSTLDPFHYLLLWFGVVGVGIGLHMPARIAASPVFRGT